MRRGVFRTTAAAGAVVLLVAAPGMAYVGPGAGVSLIGAAVGLVAAVLSAIGFILLWPIRAMLKKRRAAAKGEGGPDSGRTGGPPS